MDVHLFIAQQSRLLAAERAEDVNTAGSAISQLSDKQLIAAGLALPKLLISDCHAGLYGRCLLTFVPAAGELLPASQISVRDIVRIQPKQQQSAAAAGQSAFGQHSTEVVRRLDSALPPHVFWTTLTARSAVICYWNAQTTVWCTASRTSM